MNYSTYRFTLDIQHTKAQTTIQVTQHDTAIQFFINLTDGGKPYTIGKGCKAILCGKKADGKAIIHDCEIIDNYTRIHYTFNEQTASCLGEVTCEFRLISDEKVVLATPSFLILVEERVISDDDCVDSESDLAALDRFFIEEEERAAAEEEREAKELERIAAEKERIEAEKQRIENDENRVEAVPNMSVLDRRMFEKFGTGEKDYFFSQANWDDLQRYNRVYAQCYDEDDDLRFGDDGKGLYALKAICRYGAGTVPRYPWLKKSKWVGKYRDANPSTTLTDEEIIANHPPKDSDFDKMATLVERRPDGYIRVPKGFDYAEGDTSQYVTSRDYVDKSVATRQEKLAHPGDGQSYAFTLNGSGKPAAIQIAANSALANTMVKRDGSGRVKTAAPVADVDAVNLSFADGKYVAKNTSITDSNRYVFTQYNGKVYMAKLTQNPTADPNQTIPRRRVNGNLGTGTPQASDDAANKAYVEGVRTEAKTLVNKHTTEVVAAIEAVYETINSLHAGDGELENRLRELENILYGGTEGLTYVLTDDESYYICTGMGTSKETTIKIAKKIDRKPIVSIGNQAFINKDIVSVTIPDTIIDIGESAFGACENLLEVSLPDSVKQLGAFAFSNCSGLAEIILGDSLEVIGDSAFKNCTGLINVVIPMSATDIGNSIFSGCSSLDSITLPTVNFAKADGKTYPFGILFGTEAFGGGQAIEQHYYDSGKGDYVAKSYYIPSSLKNVKVESGVIPYGAFWNCNMLENVSIGSQVTEIGDYAFYECAGLTKASIPASVESIGEHAFYDCGGLTEVKLRYGLESIGKAAFYNCHHLTTVTIPGSVTSIEDKTFGLCIRLESVTIPSSVKSIGKEAFSTCIALRTIEVPDGVETIGWRAFCNCAGATGIAISNSVKSIGQDAFNKCEDATLVSIGNGIESIGDRAFFECASLSAVYIHDLAAWCRISFEGAFANPLYYAKNLNIGGEIPTSIIIPDTVTSIGNYAFYNCESLTSISILDSVTSIGVDAFKGCNNLTQITIQGKKGDIAGAPWGADETKTTITYTEA